MKYKHYQIVAYTENQDEIEVIVTYGAEGKPMTKVAATHILGALYHFNELYNLEIAEQMAVDPKDVKVEPKTAEEVLAGKSDVELARLWDALASPYNPDACVYGIQMDHWADMVKSELTNRGIPHYGSDLKGFVVYRYKLERLLSPKEYILKDDSKDARIFPSREAIFDLLCEKNEPALEKQGMFIESWAEYYKQEVSG